MHIAADDDGSSPESVGRLEFEDTKSVDFQGSAQLSFHMMDWH